MNESSYSDHLNQAKSIVDSPYDYIDSAADGTRKYIAYNCVFIPREIIHAAGFVPFRMFGTTAAGVVDEYIPNHCCDFAKTVIGTFVDRKLDNVDGIVFGFCCDTLHSVSSVLEDLGNTVMRLNIPTNFAVDVSLDYLADEINVFIKELEETYQLSISESALKNSIQLYQKNNELLHQLKSKIVSSSYPYTDFLYFLIAGNSILVEEHNAMLEAVNAFLDHEAASSVNPQENHRKKLIVSGLTNCNLAILKRIEELGIDLADDDLCEGSRSLLPKEYTCDVAGKSIAQIISERILHLFCPVKIGTYVDNSELLIDLVEQHGADVVLFLVFTFCDPHYLEYSAIRDNLNAKGIPSMILESLTDCDNFGQIETRIEALLENI